MAYGVLSRQSIRISYGAHPDTTEELIAWAAALFPSNPYSDSSCRPRFTTASNWKGRECADSSQFDSTNLGDGEKGGGKRERERERKLKGWSTR